MDKTLAQLWSETLAEGYRVRSSKLNGLEAWQPLKVAYANLYVKDSDPIPMATNCKTFGMGRYVISLDEKDHTDAKFKIGEHTLTNKNEPHHFYIQHFRIPFLENYKLSVVKLLQIAYNAGQFKAELEHNPKSYDQVFIDFYRQNKLDKIETFIADKYANAVPTSKLLGGDNQYANYLTHQEQYVGLKRFY